MNCPFCDSPAGFHKSSCYEYDRVPSELVGPGNSKEFMLWLAAKKKDQP